VGLEIFVPVFTNVVVENVIMMGNMCHSYDHKKWRHYNLQNLFL
jgi:hypothetical protein